LNKVDLPAADIPRVSRQVINLLGCDEREIIHISCILLHLRFSILVYTISTVASG
jgi:translation elongation factor EF-4